MPALATQAAPSPDVRAAVKALLSASTDFHTLDPDTKKAIAGSVVRIADSARALATDIEKPQQRLPVAQAMNAGNDFSGVAADKVLKQLPLSYPYYHH